MPLELLPKSEDRLEVSLSRFTHMGGVMISAGPVMDGEQDTGFETILTLVVDKAYYAEPFVEVIVWNKIKAEKRIELVPPHAIASIASEWEKSLAIAKTIPPLNRAN